VGRGVIVTHEPQRPEGGWFESADACHICGKLTRWWWGNGCVALCPACAEQTSHTAMVKLARDTGFGPIPTWKTAKPAFDVGSVIELPDGRTRKVLWFWQPEDAQLQVVYESIVPRTRTPHTAEPPPQFTGNPYVSYCNFEGFLAWARKGQIVTEET
jgi:hypothetical protein